MTVEEFKKTLAELNHQVVNFKAIEEERKTETSTKNRLRGRYNDSNMGRYK